MTEADRFLNNKLNPMTANAVSPVPTPAPSEPSHPPRICEVSSHHPKTQTEETVGNRKGMAVSSLVCAIMGGWASTLTIPAVICGHLALSRVKKSPLIYGGKRIAIAGLILGYLGLGIAVFLGLTRGFTKTIIQLLMEGR